MVSAGAYLGVVAHEGDAMTRVAWTRADIARLYPHGGPKDRSPGWTAPRVERYQESLLEEWRRAHRDKERLARPDGEESLSSEVKQTWLDLWQHV